ncbi:hypothetical protein GQ42DRAFT_54818 [Ramicandelaber brevisporus]|nr:hypothetical protein GQ42DRAFT_54818 [Ramicandelaber brevisporus]
MPFISTAVLALAAASTFHSPLSPVSAAPTSSCCSNVPVSPPPLHSYTPPPSPYYSTSPALPPVSPPPPPAKPQPISTGILYISDVNGLISPLGTCCSMSTKADVFAVEKQLDVQCNRVDESTDLFCYVKGSARDVGDSVKNHCEKEYKGKWSEKVLECPSANNKAPRPPGPPARAPSQF